jgi:mono/diheme cytochrome c family protein
MSIGGVESFRRASLLAAATGAKALRSMTMLGRGVWLAIGSLTLCVASPAAAQGNLDQGKTAAQLYASACATCHKSPQSVSNTKRFLGLESFLSQHYTSSRESAAILAAYLRGMQTPSADSKRGRSVAKRTSEAMPPEPAPSESEDDIPRPPADIPDVKR